MQQSFFFFFAEVQLITHCPMHHLCLSIVYYELFSLFYGHFLFLILLTFDLLALPMHACS